MCAEPEGAPMEQQLLGWKNGFGSGVGIHTTTSGFEGAWNSTPTQWDNNYLETSDGQRLGAHREPGRPQAVDLPRHSPAPSRRQRPDVTHAPMMSTADMAMKMDPIYGPSRSASATTPNSSMTPTPVRGTS